MASIQKKPVLEWRYDLARHITHNIASDAVAIVSKQTPRTWACEEQDVDYGIDLKIEIFKQDASDPNLQANTGIELGVQVKGSDKALKKVHEKKFVTAQVTVTNLLDHLKRRYPVYLFRVHNEKEKVYWLFLQEYLLSLPNTWKSRCPNSKMTIHVPVANNDLNTLNASIHQHVAFVNERFPGSPEAAIYKVRREFSEKDDRFDVDVSTKGNDVYYMLNPKEPVQLKAVFSAEDEDSQKQLNRKIKSLEETGKTTKFSTGELKILGSPIFEGWNSGQIVVSSVPLKDYSVSLEMSDERDSILASLYFADTERTGGSREVVIRSMPDNPLSILVKARFDKEDFTLNINVDLSRWNEKLILDLPYFEVCRKFLSHVNSMANLKVILVHREGNQGEYTCKFENPFENPFEDAVKFFDVICKARELAERFGKNPKLPEEYSFGKIQDLHWVVFDGSKRKTKRMFQSDKTSYLPKEKAKSQLSKSECFAIRQHFPNWKESLFGEELEIGEKVVEYVGLKMVSLSDRIKLPKELKDQIPIGFEPTSNATMEVVDSKALPRISET